MRLSAVQEKTTKNGRWQRVLAAALIVFAAFAVVWWGRHHAAPNPGGPGEGVTESKDAQPHDVTPEGSGKDARPDAGAAEGPLLAIILDDFGWGVAGTREALGLSGPITVAVIPGGPTSVADAKEARARGHEVILHLPMEPLGREGMGNVPDVVLTTLSTEEVRRIVEKDLARVEGASGINNHTGSKATADERVVTAVVRVAKERGLYIIDSRTAANSVLFFVARREGVPAAANEVFLDNVKEESYIKARILDAVNAARKKGKAVAIGHVHPVTVACIRAMIPEIEKRGVTLVPASKVVE